MEISLAPLIRSGTSLCQEAFRFNLINGCRKVCNIACPYILNGPYWKVLIYICNPHAERAISDRNLAN